MKCESGTLAHNAIVLMGLETAPSLSCTNTTRAQKSTAMAHRIMK